MTLLFFWALAAFGFSYAVGHSKISLPVRERIARRAEKLVELMECPACLGFWMGLVQGAARPELLPFSAPRPLAALALGFFTCGTGFILGRLTGWIRED